MITQHLPSDWQELQREVVRILSECKMEAQVERTMELARGSAVVDVVAVETLGDRTNTIFCECKLWQSSVPKMVVHAFRTVVAEGGANVGYLITGSSFQRGAYDAASLTNIKLLTWVEFQSEFESLWLKNYFRPEITRRLDRFSDLVEPLPPTEVSALSPEDTEEFFTMRNKYFALGVVALSFTTYAAAFSEPDSSLPIRRRLSATADENYFPAGLLDSTSYREVFEILVSSCAKAEMELSEILSRARAPRP